MLWIKALAVACLLSIGPAAAQQLPPPFGQTPPDIPNPGAKTLPRCTPEYQKQTAEQLENLEKLRGVSGEQIMLVCDGIQTAERSIEMVEKALGREPGSLKEQLEAQVADMGKPYGIPRIDFRFAKHVCMQSAGETERTIVTEIGRLKSEERRCAGI